MAFKNFFRNSNCSQVIVKKITIVDAKAGWFSHRPQEDSWFCEMSSPQYTAYPQAWFTCVLFYPKTKAWAHTFIMLQGCIVILRNTYTLDMGKPRPNSPEVLKEAWKKKSSLLLDSLYRSGQRMSLWPTVTARAEALGLREASWGKTPWSRWSHWRRQPPTLNMIPPEILTGSESDQSSYG